MRHISQQSIVDIPLVRKTAGQSMSSEWEPKCNFKDSRYIFRGKGWTCILRNVMVSRAVWWCFLCQKHFAVHHLHHPLDITKSDIAASDIRMFLLDCIGNSHSKALFTELRTMTGVPLSPYFKILENRLVKMRLIIVLSLSRIPVTSGILTFVVNPARLMKSQFSWIHWKM